MAQKLTAAMPPNLDLPPNWVLQLTAVSPTTGAVVSGVNVSNVAIIAGPVTPATADSEIPPGPPPIFVPLALE